MARCEANDRERTHAADVGIGPGALAYQAGVLGTRTQLWNRSADSGSSVDANDTHIKSNLRTRSTRIVVTSLLHQVLMK